MKNLKKKMFVDKLFLLLCNIVLVFCLEPIQDCKNLDNFIEKSSKDYNNFECCQSNSVKCNESQSSIVEL